MNEENTQVFIENRFKDLGIGAIFIFPLVAFITFRAQDIIPFFFGESARSAVLPFQVGAWGLVFLFYVYILLQIALFLNKKYLVFSSLIIEAFFAWVLNFYSIPLYGQTGIGISILVSLAAVFMLIAVSLNGAGIRIPFYRTGEKPAIGTMGLMVALHYLDTAQFFLIFIAGAATYFLIYAGMAHLQKGLAEISQG